MSSSGRGHVAGPLAPYAEGFREHLLGQGYSWGSAAHQIHLMAHLSRWLETRGLVLAALDEHRAGQFAASRRADGYAALRSVRALVPLLSYLRGLGVVVPPQVPAPPAPADVLAARFGEYLARERGLAGDSIRSYRGWPAVSLPGRSWVVTAARRASAADVTGFVRRECARRGVASAKATVTGLRALLRFLYLTGQISAPLTGAVPSAACWQLAALPRAVSPAEVDQLMDSCDRDSAAGRRDFAILVLLARLGLRAGEVAALDLSDIRWRQGEIVVRGKGSRRDILPLPADAGEAVASWLAGSRPRPPPARRCSCGCPRRTAGSPPAACRMSSAGPAHGRRHRGRGAPAAALRGGRVLAAGGKLAEIGQVLRHAQPGTTAIYAKADLIALSPLARPWPGGPR